MLAVVLLADRPPSRRAMAELLFPDANDPLGALRWALSQLRSGLAGQVVLGGDPVSVRLDPGCRVDVLDFLTQPQAFEHGEILLEGADGLAGPDFDLWLATCRQRIATARGTAVADAGAAATRAALIGALVAAGDRPAALTQLRRWSVVLRQELNAGRRGVLPPRNGRRVDGDVIGRIEAGEAAVRAGAAKIGMRQLRDAVRLARQRDDESLQATALCTFGSLLVHAVAAHTPEGTAALREASRLARRTGDHGLAADALRELGYIANCAGDARAARRWLTEAVAAAGDDRGALSAVRAIEGMYLADRGLHTRAVRALRQSADLADSTGRLRQAAWSTTNISRSFLQRGELEAATEYAELGLQMAMEARWTATLPWMDSILADLDLAAGRAVEARSRLRQAWSLSLVLEDCCWQGLTARGLGLAAFAHGDLPDAVRWLDEAVRRARQHHDRYAWAHIWAQDALCRVTVAAHLPRADTDVAELAQLAAATHQPDFAVRAELHRAALGAPAGHTTARAIASAIDNPELARMAARRRPTPG